MNAPLTWPAHLTISQASIYTGLPGYFLRDLIRKGVLSSIRPTPRRTRVSREELDRYLASVHTQAV